MAGKSKDGGKVVDLKVASLEAGMSGNSHLEGKPLREGGGIAPLLEMGISNSRPFPGIKAYNPGSRILRMDFFIPPWFPNS